MASTLDTRENKRYNGINMFHSDAHGITTIRLAHMRQKLLNLTEIARTKNGDKNLRLRTAIAEVCVCTHSHSSTGHHTVEDTEEKNSCLFLPRKTHLKSPKQTKSIIYLNDFGFVSLFSTLALPCHFLLDSVTTTIYTPWERKHLNTMVALSEFHYGTGQHESSTKMSLTWRLSVVSVRSFLLLWVYL